MNSRERLAEEIRERLVEYLTLPIDAFDPDRDSVSLSLPPYDGADVFNALAALLDGWPTMGPRTRILEDRMAEMLGTPNAIFVGSGASATFLVMQLLASAHSGLDRPLRPGDEVLTPAVTWPTTVSAIHQAACVPVFLDVEPDRLTLDPNIIESQISDRSRAILLVHPFGYACDMDSILEIARKHDLVVIEDACEAMGSRLGGRYLGTIGDFGTLSFYFSYLATSVEGGMILTSDDRRADVLRSIRANGWLREIRDPAHRSFLQNSSHEIDASFLFPYPGFNCKPTDIGAGLLLGQLNRMETLIQARRNAAASLRQRLADLTRWIHLPQEHSTERWSAFCFPILLRESLGGSNREMIGHFYAIAGSMRAP